MPQAAKETLNHDAAIAAICGCAATVTILSYQEAIEGYLKLRGIEFDGGGDALESEKG